MSEAAARAALERMNLREVALAPHYTGLLADLRQMSAADPLVEAEAAESRRTEICEAYGFTPSVVKKPFAFSEGLAIIPVSGSLINRFGACWGFVTGYNFIRSQLNAALADEDVKGIVLDLNSYGGEAAGCFELSDEIFAARSIKPILGVIDSNCYSACYAIGSACTQLVSIPSGGAGSIGVICMHVDVSKMYDNFGVKITMIRSGEHKADGNPYEGLSKEVLADIQKGVDSTREKFVNLVARNRDIDAKTVHDTEARIYRTEDAIGLGLIDAIATPSEAVQAFLDELSGSTTTEKDDMSAETTKPGAAENASPQVDEKAVANAAAEARTSERARVSGIMSCEEAKGRSALANHLALNTDMSVEDAKGVLGASAKESEPTPAAATPANQFKEAMDGSKHPQVGAEAGAGGDDDKGEAPHLQILRAQESATGLKLVTN